MSDAPLLSQSLTLQIPLYLKGMECGNCLKFGTLRIFGTYPSLDAAGTYPSLTFHSTELYTCIECGVLYNSSTEKLDLNNAVAQIEWLERENFYAVPSDKELFLRKVDEANNIFLFLKANNAWDIRWKNYFEIGGGSGITAVAALRHFEKVTVTDLSDERMRQAQKMSESDYYTIIEPAKSSEVKFDFFLAWHVFEHLVKPGQVMLNVIDQLTPGGALCIQVPLLTERHVYPGHIFMHNQNSLETILKGTRLKNRKYFYDTDLCAMTLFGVKQQ